MRIRHATLPIAPNGFSLVELLLTLVLILCLAAASVFSFTALNRTANLDEGLNRLESLIRFAQAEAATTGRKVRLQFPAARPLEEGAGAELREIRVLWEPDVLNSPGVFQVYSNKAWSEEIVNEIVGVAAVRPLTGANIVPSQYPPAPASSFTNSAPLEEAAGLAPLAGMETDFAETEEFPGITFYPDGSCDSAEIVLASRNGEDPRLVEVTLSGILGSVSSRFVSASADDPLAGEIFEEETAANPGYPAGYGLEADPGFDTLP